MYQFIEDIASKKIQLRIHPSKRIHAKIYIFREAVKHEHGYGSVITGSSNLSDAGLKRNFEFNVELRDNSDIEFASETFEALWNESVDIQIEDKKLAATRYTSVVRRSTTIAMVLRILALTDQIHYKIIDKKEGKDYISISK